MTRDGRQRWYCLDCHRTYSWRLRSHHRFHWFRLWIVEGYSVRQLSRLSRVSTVTMRRTLTYWLHQEPHGEASWSRIKNIILDGTFIHRSQGIYAAMDAHTNRLIAGGYNIKERGRDLVRFYEHLASCGLRPESATVDGNTQQITYLRAQWPCLILQRCIVHVQRQGLSWCRRKPKRTDAKHLRELFLLLTDVHTQTDAREFIKRFEAWEQRFGFALDSSTNRGWVYSDLLRARSMLQKAIPDIFHYVQSKSIPRSTNALEGYFSRLKEHYRRHRGLAFSNRDAYFKWYFYLVPL